MNKNRLEAFTDGVVAIIITIMVLELKVPHGSSLDDIESVIPTFLSYVLSFIYVGIYWNNHHHLFQAVKRVNGAILWANLHLLFWLSLIPFVTAWAGENHFTDFPVALYGFVLMMDGIAYFILTKLLISSHGKGSVLASAVGSDFKGKISVVIYIAAIVAAFFFHLHWVACVLYVFVACMWLKPDSRIARALPDSHD